jgi:DNA-binding transcriptional LysR family regulator
MNYEDRNILDTRTMELADLHIFRTVVECGGITRAAERLHRVQSNVTTRIKLLERDLGVPLFVREGRHIILAPAGRVLLPYAERMLALAAEAREVVQGGRPSGVLRLGVMESTAAVRLPRPLSVFLTQYPGVAVELSTGDTASLAPRVLAGSLDAALVAEPIADARLEMLPVYDEELVIVANASHPSIAAPHDVRKPTMLAFAPGCPHRARLERWFAKHGAVCERVVELSSYHAILGCAVAGMGVGLMPKSVLDSYAERRRLSVHPLSGEFRSARTLLIWRKETPQAKVKALAEVLLSEREKPRRRRA